MDRWELSHYDPMRLLLRKREAHPGATGLVVGSRCAEKAGRTRARGCWLLGGLVSVDVALAHWSSFALVLVCGLLLTLFCGGVAGLVTVGSDQRRIKQWIEDHPEPARVKRRGIKRS